MQQLNKQYLTETLNKPYYGDRPERVIQFGEGGFLRAFFDYMLDTAKRHCGKAHRLWQHGEL